jgi:hypothetical protein
MVADEAAAGAPVRAAQRANSWAEETVKAQKLKAEQDRLAEEQGLQSDFSEIQKEYDAQENKRLSVRKQFMASAAYAAHIALSGGDKQFAVDRMRKSNPYVTDFGIDDTTGNLVIHEEHPETGATFDRQITKPEYMGLLSAGMPNVYGDKGRATQAEDRALKQDTVRSVNASRTAPRPARSLAPAEEIKALSSALKSLDSESPAAALLTKRIEELSGASAAPAAGPEQEIIDLKKWALAQASGDAEKAKKLFIDEYNKRHGAQK